MPVASPEKLTTLPLPEVDTSLYIHSLEEIGQRPESFKSRTLEYMHPSEQELQEAFGFVDRVREQNVVRQSHALLQEVGDLDTIEHEDRTAIGVAILGKRMGFSDEVLWLAVEAAEVHDVGKADPEIQACVQSPENIREVSKEERDRFTETMSRHSQIGADILRQIAETQQEALVLSEVAATHHSYDTESTQSQLAHQYDFITQPIVVADVVDATASDRKYRSAMSEDAVRENLRKLTVDPLIIELFFDPNATVGTAHS